jgi:hypothetical protein
LEDRKPWGPLVATSADSVPSSNLVRITLAPIGTTFGNLQWRRYWNNFTFEYSSNNNIFSFVAMSADSIPSSKTNIFQSKLYTLIYCRHFRTYSRCALFDWSDTVFLRRNVTRRRISNTVLQPRYWGSEADSIEVCRLPWGLSRLRSPAWGWRIIIALFRSSKSTVRYNDIYCHFMDSWLWPVTQIKLKLIATRKLLE